MSQNYQKHELNVAVNFYATQRGLKSQTGPRKFTFTLGVGGTGWGRGVHTLKKVSFQVADE